MRASILVFNKETKIFNYHRSKFVCAFIGCLIFNCTSLGAAESSVVRNDFESGIPGKFPPGFLSEPHQGGGQPGVWTIVARVDAKSGKYVLSQVTTDDTYTRLLPLIHTGTDSADVDVKVDFINISGIEDRIAGLVIRYQDANNYVVAYANSLSMHLRIYKMKHGDFRQIASIYEEKLTSGRWYNLRVVAKGTNYSVYLNNALVLEGFDKDPSISGKTGIFTKADSVALFDDFQSTSLDVVNPSK